MPWRGHNGHFCHVCGKHRSECGPLSARYKCSVCGERRMIGNLRAMLRHDGAEFDHWKRRSLAALGVFLPPPEPEPELDAHERAA